MQIHTSVVGRNCKIGKGARICGSHLHDNVVIEDGASITDSLLCEGSAVMKDAVLNTGVILSFKVSPRQMCAGHQQCSSSLARQLGTRNTNVQDLKIPLWYLSEPYFLSHSIARTLCHPPGGHFKVRSAIVIGCSLLLSWTF